jgi:coproporphyrinogen III oxidase
MSQPTKETIEAWFKELQDSICNALEEADQKGKFQEDVWERPGGGGGRTRIMQHGRVIEKGGVNFSAVHGTLPERIQQALKVNSRDFFASGVSIVLHPNNPHVPIIHMNTRYFELADGTYWFGGGIDLTPHYVQEDDAAEFHQRLKNVCDETDTSFYSEYKKWADDYFFIPHRNETRGVGGIFFDRLKENEAHSKESIFDFVKNVGSAFAPAYTHLMHKHGNKSFTDAEKNWQLLRRGRYVEFNLVYDKGTKFGLETSGRIESILMSLPEMASWQYDVQPDADSKEKATLDLLKKDINWIHLNQ